MSIDLGCRNTKSNRSIFSLSLLFVFVSLFDCLFVYIIDGELFVGTVADFSGMDPLIYREPLRTEQYDATNLNGKITTTIHFSVIISSSSSSGEIVLIHL